MRFGGKREGALQKMKSNSLEEKRMEGRWRVAFVLILTACVFCQSVYSFDTDSVVQFNLKNGVPVYLNSIEENRIDVVYIVVKGGIQYVTKETSGLEDAVFSLLQRGSEKYSYADLQKFQYDFQSSFTSSAMRDGSVFGMTSLSHYFDETFDRFIDAFLHPLFSQKEYALLMAQYGQSIQSLLNNPSAMLFYYAQKSIYSGHPFEVSSSVTPDSLKNITLEAIKAHYTNMMDAQRICVVACGSFERASLEKKLNSTLGKIPAQRDENFSKGKKSVPKLKIEGENEIFVHEASSGTGFVMRAFASPEVSSADYPIAQIVCDIYSDILFNVVRENYGACYTPESSVLSSEAPFGFEYLYRTSDLVNFARYVEEARGIMAKGKVISGRDSRGDYVFEDLDDRLEGYINSYINRKYASDATTSGRASRMCAGLLQGDDISFSDRITEQAKRTTSKDVLRVFNLYWISESSRWFAVVSPEDEKIINLP